MPLNSDILTNFIAFTLNSFLELKCFECLLADTRKIRLQKLEWGMYKDIHRIFNLESVGVSKTFNVRLLMELLRTYKYIFDILLLFFYNTVDTRCVRLSYVSGNGWFFCFIFFLYSIKICFGLKQLHSKLTLGTVRPLYRKGVSLLSRERFLYI